MILRGGGARYVLLRKTTVNNNNIQKKSVLKGVNFLNGFFVLFIQSMLEFSSCPKYHIIICTQKKDSDYWQVHHLPIVELPVDVYLALGDVPSEIWSRVRDICAVHIKRKDQIPKIWVEQENKTLDHGGG